MSSTKDLHLCGVCKKIFNDINLFLEHKSQCSSSQNNITFSPNPQEISLENGLFCNETILDLTVLAGGSFPLVLQYGNEEVVSANPPHPQQDDPHAQLNQTSHKNQDSYNKILTSSKINEEDVATLLANQLGLCKDSLTQESQQNAGEIKTASIPEQLSCTETTEIEDEPIEEVSEETVVSQKQKNVCKLCNFVTAYHQDLVRHMRKHTGERPFACCVCDKKFARQDKLVTHKRIHLGDKRYKCQLCEYATTDSGALRKHLRVHTDERPHKCQICSYRARNTSHMTVHLRTHTGDSPFFCQLETCGRTFKTSTDLKRHLKVHKLDSSSPTYSSFDDASEKYSFKHFSKHGKTFDKPSSCLICQDFTYKGVSNKRQWPRGRRGMLALCIKSHKCPYCSAAFVRHDSLRSHLKQHQHTSPDRSSRHVEEKEREVGNCSVRSTSPEVSSAPDNSVANEGSASALLYVARSDLQDSLIPLDNEGAVHYIMNSSYL